jgi:hypothetical protein
MTGEAIEAKKAKPKARGGAIHAVK